MKSILTTGFALFVVGTSITSYCGYMERYIADAPPDLLTFPGWALLIVGLLLFLAGILQSPIRRN